jgi:hypothetical protein
MSTSYVLAVRQKKLHHTAVPKIATALKTLWWRIFLNFNTPCI